MEKWKHCLFVLTASVFMVLFSQVALAEERGVTDNGLQWLYEDGIMAITGYSGDAAVVQIPPAINGKKVTMIYDGAFWCQNSLTSITIPNSVTTIRGEAFHGCSGLTNISIPNSVTSIGPGAFQSCSGLTSVSIPNSITELAGGVFGDCTGLTNISIPNSVTSIDCFIGCTGLKSIVIPNSVTELGSNAFDGCTGLESIVIPNSVTSIGGFWSEDYTGTIHDIRGGAFYGCTGLKNVTLPKSISKIETGAFFGCTGLKSITIPKTTVVAKKAFGYYMNAFSTEKKVDGFTVYGYYGTSAEEYANQHGFSFIGSKTNLSEDACIYYGNDESYLGRSIPAQEYTGAELKPKLIVKLNTDNRWVFDIKSLVEKKDYTLSYSNNINPGTATVKVTGINHYYGSLSMHFTIIANSKWYKAKEIQDQKKRQEKISILKAPTSVKAKVKKNKVTVFWKKIKKNKSGKKFLKQIKSIEVQYSTDKSFKANAKSKKVGKTKTKVKLKLKRKTTYYLRVRYVGKDGVSRWSKVKKVKTK